MSSQALKTGLELTVQTPAFGYNQKQLECSTKPLVAHNIRTSLSQSLDFSMPQTCYQPGSKEQKERPISRIGHGHASRQGVYVFEPSFHRDKHTILMGHDHMAHIKVQKHMADESLDDRKSCEEPGCNEFVCGGVVYCKSHSGGRSSQQLSFLQSSHESSGLCMPPVKRGQCNGPGSSTVTCTEKDMHIKYEGDDRYKDISRNTQSDSGQYHFRGADMFCKHEGCNKQAQGNTMYCKLHSSATKGCMVQGCMKGAHGGTPLCIGHGGGKRCIIPGCPNAACGQGRSDHCVRHGGGKRCKFDGCGKGAQGNTDFCIRHGGGRRCRYEECTKSAQGRTDFCIRHGGGSRCKFQGCITSAKWGTDFCSVHRKSLLIGDNAILEALPVPPEKRRRAKKPKKAVKPSESQGTATTASDIIGSSTQEMGMLPVATLVTNHEMTPNTVTTAQAAVAIAPQVAVPLSMKSPMVSAEKDAAGASRAMLGL